MLIPNSEYVEKYCEIAEIIFLEKFHFTFDSYENLEPPYDVKWEECIKTALQILNSLGIEQDITA